MYLQATNKQSVHISPHSSEMIAQNSQNYKDQFDHFNTLYKQAQLKQKKRKEDINKHQGMLFQPKINTKSASTITETFQERLQKSLIQKQKQKENQNSDTQCSFKPKIGRPPKELRLNRSTDSSATLWDHLYAEKLRKNPTVSTMNELPTPPLPTISSTSSIYYENLIEKRIAEVFTVLDGDEDEQISPDNISIENLTKNQLLFLRPIFQEMDELQAVLDFNQFKKALTLLLNQSDPSSKGIFLSEKRKNQEQSSFTPQINSKSKQLALSRVPTANCIHDQLYEQGLKELQKKEFKIQQQKAKQQQKQLEGCSFKPHLINTSKYYIQKVLGKKINQKFQDSPKFI